LDFSFKQPNITHGVCEHGPILIGQGEVNHFDSRYRPEGEKWTMPRLDEQYVHFRCAREHFERDGRQIINASRQSALDVFERLPFERVI